MTLPVSPEAPYPQQESPIKSTSLFACQLLFIAAMAWRVVLPFIHNPMHHLYSDPGRHWLNGVRFYTPDVMGGSDPFMYQLWVHMVWMATSGNRFGVACFTALLCAGMGWFWFKALREVVSERAAYLGGALIAATPTLTFIYALFMNETLLLTLMAAATYYSLRTLKKPDSVTCLIAGMLWVFAIYTRIVALPVAAIFMLLALSRQRYWAPIGLACVLTFAALAYPACWHSRLALNFCAPLGNSYLNEIYHRSLSKSIGINVQTKGRWGFMSPSQVTRPLEPFTKWYPERFGEYFLEVDPAHGRRDWAKAAAEVDNAVTLKSTAWTLMENFVVYFFAPSWPDNHGGYFYGRVNIMSRWIWFPLTIIFIGVCLRQRRRFRDDPAAALLPVTGLMLTVMVLLQHSAVMESRYRKPVEPYIIAGLVVLLARRKEEGKENVVS